VLEALGAFRSCHDDFHVFGKYLWQPKRDICLFSSLAVNELIHSLNNDHYLVVNLLCAINDQLFLNLRTADVQPIRKELSDVFFEEIHVLFQFKRFPELDDDAVERVKIIAIVTAVRGEVHYRQSLFLAICVDGLVFLPVD
jgi:hypothetical protein